MARVPLSKQERFEVFKRDDFTCRYCGRQSPDVTLQVDHVIAVANGGTNDPGNLVTSCTECNAGKSDRPLAAPGRGSSARAKVFYIRGIVRNRFPEVDQDRALRLIQRAQAAGLDLDKLEILATVVPTWPTLAGRIYASLPGGTS